MEDKELSFDKIVALAGSPGLYFVIGQRPNGLILQEVGNPSRKFATSARQRVSVLADIAMFTEDEDVNLGDIFLAAKALEDKGEQLPQKKDSDEALKTGFEKVLPKYDKERVYVSDMKKMFGWYHLLKGHFDLNKIKEAKEETEKETTKASDKTTGANTKGKKPAAPKKVNQKVKTTTGATKITKASTPRKSS